MRPALPLAAPRRAGALLLALAFTGLLLAAPAQASLGVFDYWGNPTSAASEAGGEFSSASSPIAGPAGIALNSATGNVYVADSGNNRIEQFDPSKPPSERFVRAWGVDVAVANANEMQALAVNAAAGTFKVTFGADITADLAFNASAAQLQSALNALPSIATGGGSVTVSGGPGSPGATSPYLIIFKGSFAGTDVATQIAGSSGSTPLSGGTGPGADQAVGSTFAEGGASTTSFEICEAPAPCKKGAADSGGGGMTVPVGVAVNQQTGDVYVTERDARRVQQFDRDGNFIRAWGGGVVAAGPHNVPVNERQRVVLENEPTGGTFQLLFDGSTPADTSAPIPFNASPAQVQTALEGIAAIGAGNVAVSSPKPGGGAVAGGPYYVDFIGALADSDVPLIGNDNTGLTPVGRKWVEVKTIVAGDALEICTAADRCMPGREFGSAAGAFGSEIINNGFNSHPAVVPAGAPGGGNLVVPDPMNSRVQEFTPAGVFVRAFGWDVTRSGPDDSGVDEKTAVKIVATGGTFTLAFEGMPTAPIPFNASASQVESALNGLEAIASVGGSVAVSGGPGDATGSSPYLITFGGSLGGDNLPYWSQQGIAIDAFSTGLTIGAGAKSATATTIANGGALEVCTASSSCKNANSGAGVGQFNTRNPQRVAVDSTGAIYSVESKNGEPQSSLRVQKWTPQAGVPSLAPVVFAPGFLTGSWNTSSSTSSSNSPIAIAVDPGDDHVFALKDVGAGEGDPPAEVGESRILELDSTGNLLDTHMAKAEIRGIPESGNNIPLNGFAVAPGGGRAYVTSKTPVARVYALDTVPAPGVSIGEATNVTGGSAVLHATVSPSITPTGLKTFYQFEYSKNGFEWTRVPSAFADLGNGTAGGTSSTCPAPAAATCEVTQAISGLDPNQVYQVRVVAKTEFNGGSATVDGPSFLTAPSLPAVTTGVALWSNAPRPDAPAPSLMLKGVVDARHDDTTYRFEYVDEDSYLADVNAGGEGFEHAEATAEAEVGHALGDVNLQQSLLGLDPGKSYRYRIAAVNSSGEQKGLIRSVQPPQAGDSFYELVSNGNSWGSGINGIVGAIADSNARAQFSAQAFGQPKSVPSPSTVYTADRGPAGWTVAAMAPEPETASGSFSGTRFMFSSDLGNTLWPEATVDERLRGQVRWSIVALDDSLTPVTGLLTPLARSGNGEIGAEYALRGAATDLSSFVFANAAPGVGESVQLLPGEPLLRLQNHSNLYEISNAGMLRLVNRDTDPSPGVPGAILGASCGALLGGTSNAKRAVSGDGSVIYFSTLDTTTAPTGSCSDTTGRRLFKRVDGETTVRISAPQCSPACPGPNGNDEFRGASRDGSIAFFTTLRRLLNSDTDNTADVYAYDSDPPAGQPSLVQVSAGEVVADDHPSAGSGAMVLGVPDVAADGSRVYFVAKGRLTAAATKGANNLYVYQRDDAHPAGRIAFIASLAAADVENTNSTFLPERRYFALPNSAADGDGRFLLFPSAAKLVAADSDEKVDVYRYADSSGQLLCLSCAGNGSFDASTATRPSTEFSYSYDAQRVRPASADVATVAFVTAEPISSADQNAAADVYLWREGEGLSLVSGGTEGAGVNPGELSSGVSPDGRNVFFVTRAALAEADGNNQFDLYDARVGGGFPGKPLASARCDSDATCHGGAQAPPAATTPGSSTFSGPGNEPAPKACPKGKVRKHGHCAKACPKGKVRKHGRCVKKQNAKKHRKAGKRRAGYERGGKR